MPKPPFVATDFLICDRGVRLVRSSAIHCALLFVQFRVENGDFSHFH